MDAQILLRRHVDLRAPEPPAQILAALRGVIAGSTVKGAPFTGSVWDGGFLITRINEYRSTFMPQVRGTIEVADGGARARLTLRPHRSVFVFLAIWYLFLAVFAGIVIAAHLLLPQRSLLYLLIPASLAAFSWYLATSVFRADARWALWALSRHVPALEPPDCADVRG